MLIKVIAPRIILAYYYELTVTNFYILSMF